MGREVEYLCAPPFVRSSQKGEGRRAGGDLRRGWGSRQRTGQMMHCLALAGADPSPLICSAKKGVKVYC